MITPRRKKRLILSVSGLAVLAFVWLWHAGGLLKGPGSVRKDAYRAGIKTIALQTPPVIVTKKIGALAADDIHADESKQPIVRKKLPEPQPMVVNKKITDATQDGVRLAESTLPVVVRKKLPPMPPAPVPQAEPQTVAPMPAGEAAKPEEPAPKAQTGPVPGPTAAAAPSGPEPAVPAAPSAPAPPPQPPAPESVTEPAPEKTPPVAAAPKPAAIKPPAAERSAFPFSLLLSSCREQENAVATIHYYRKDGVAPHIVQTELGGKGTWWRTLSGSYKTMETARQAKKALGLPDAIVVKTPYANLVGEFPTEKEALEQSTRLSQKGLFPYTLHEPGQPVRLLIGAFPDRQTAEQHRRELDAKGIASQVVLR